MPEVSVIITTFNRAHFLREAINSVLSQTYQDFEVVVVDDGSTDDTRETIKSYTDPRVKYIYQKNQGAGAARNTGLQASEGRLIALLDADDIWLPEKLELQIKALALNPRASVVYSDMYFFGSKSSTTPETFFQWLKWPPPKGKVIDKMVVRSFGHPSTLMTRREVFDTIGLFDENLPYCDDYDMLIRLAAYFEFEVVPLPLVKYRLHPDQISHNLERVIANHLTVFAKARQLPVIRSAQCHFRYAGFLVRQGKFNRGFKELLALMQTDFWQLFPLTLSLTGRLLSRIFPVSALKFRLSVSNISHD
jgi:glycosyltransferase involved in cell wall biosynthesis